VSRTVTKGDLRLRARRAANMEFSDFIENAEFDDLVDQAYTDLVDELAKNAIHLFEASAPITTTGLTDTFDLPNDFYRVLAIEYTVGGRVCEVPEVAFAARNFMRTTRNGFARGYRIVGATVKFLPLPPPATYTLLYVPCPAEIADLDDDTQVEGIAGWDELIVVVAALAALRKEGSDTSDLEKYEFKLRARIREAAANLGQAVRRRDDRARWAGRGLAVDGYDDGEDDGGVYGGFE
jgi:hypothetical protein